MQQILIKEGVYYKYKLFIYHVHDTETIQSVTPTKRCINEHLITN